MKNSDGVLFVRRQLKGLVYLIENRPLLGLIAISACWLTAVFLSAALFASLFYFDLTSSENSKSLFAYALLLWTFTLGPLFVKCIDGVLFFGSNPIGDFSLRVLKNLAGMK